MKGYGQFCPIARASEILAERWTPVILRNLLYGCTSFSQLVAGAPGISRTLLSQRLRGLQRAGIIDISSKADGNGSVYELTAMGRELWSVLHAMGDWGAKWLELAPATASPDVVLWSWCNAYLQRDRLPDRRVLTRFDFPDQPKSRQRLWLLVDNRHAEVCHKHPGFDEDLIVVVHDAQVFARWHLGLVEWVDALRADAVHVDGPRDLARARCRHGTAVGRHRRSGGSRCHRACRCRVPRRLTDPRRSRVSRATSFGPKMTATTRRGQCGTVRSTGDRCSSPDARPRRTWPQRCSSAVTGSCRSRFVAAATASPAQLSATTEL